MGAFLPSSFGAKREQKREDLTASMMQSARFGHWEEVRYFLNFHHLDINAQDSHGNTLLMVATQKKAYHVLSKLLKSPSIKPNIQNNGGDTALIDATYNNDIASVRLLLKNPNTNPNIQNRCKYTALIYAAMRNHLALLKLLLSHKEIDPNIQNNGDDTALLIAASNNHIEGVKLLLGHKKIKPNVHSRKYYLNTALICAAYHKNFKLIELLLSHKDINPNIQNNQGDTLSIMAARKADLISLEYLFSCSKIDFSITNNNNENVCSILQEKIKKKILPQNKVNEITQEYRRARHELLFSGYLGIRDRKQPICPCDIFSIYILYQGKGLFLKEFQKDKN